MLKTILAGTAALAIAGTSLVYAQQGGDRKDTAKRWRPSMEDIAAFGDARIAGLKAGLKLTPAQEKNWPAVESALRDYYKQRTDRFAARASAQRSDDPIERLQRRADRMTERGAGLKKLATAAAPLYQSLDEAQKKRFMVLARLDRRHGQWRGHRGFSHHKWERRGSRAPETAPKAQ